MPAVGRRQHEPAAAPHQQQSLTPVLPSLFQQRDELQGEDAAGASSSAGRNGVYPLG